MEPTIIGKGQIILVGFSFFGDPFQASGGWTEENEIGRLWQRFMDYLQKYGDQFPPIKTPTVSFEVHVKHPETLQKGHVEVFVGMEVSDITHLPVELLVKILPPTTYAVFTLRGEQIKSDWPRLIYMEWLPVSAYELSHPYLIQWYDERFKGLERLEDSTLDVYVPVKSRHHA